MLHLPTFKVTLNPCPVNPATTFTPHPNGHFCGSCQRVVQDFSQSDNPLVELAAARTASPDGRVCGRFRREQVVIPPAPTLSRRLRWFLMALVLVVGQGLTAREALAQVRKPVSHKAAAPPKKHAPTAKKKPTEEVEMLDGAVVMGTPEIEYAEPEQPAPTGDRVYTYVEQMPELPGGGGIAAIVAYIQKQVRWPAATSMLDVEGRVFASFVVDSAGRLKDARIVKGLHPLLDAEALRVIQMLPTFKPGRQNGQPVAVSFTVPVTFKRY